MPVHERGAMSACSALHGDWTLKSPLQYKHG